jgi:hypothetical protein
MGNNRRPSGSQLQKIPRLILFAGIGVHYLGVLLVSYISDFADWKYIEKAWQIYPLALGGGITLYLLGQISIWAYWLKR